jgi:hypothetical protein
LFWQSAKQTLFHRGCCHPSGFGEIPGLDHSFATDFQYLGTIFSRRILSFISGTAAPPGGFFSWIESQ